MRIYLDHNATTPTHPAVLEEMQTVLGETWGNPSSIHREGQQARRVLDRARLRVARALGAAPDEIVFTSGGTESVGLALNGGSKPTGHMIVSAVEHQAVSNTCLALKSRGMQITTLGVDALGRVDPDEAGAALHKETQLISVMQANNEVGSLQPITAIATRARERCVLSHTDAVQAFGKIPVQVRDLGVDLLSVSAHKLGGPKGVGALFVRHGTELRPQIHGGHQERRRRAGTENLAGIAGFGKACALLADGFDERVQAMQSLRDEFEQGVLATITGVAVNGDPQARLPNTSNLTFAGLESEGLLMNLDLMGVAASAASACSAELNEPSRVLQAMGRTDEQALSSLRFSFGPGNTQAEVERAVEILPELVEQIRSWRAPLG
jgi:cysteine desulfurase